MNMDMHMRMDIEEKIPILGGQIIYATSESTEQPGILGLGLVSGWRI